MVQSEAEIIAEKQASVPSAPQVADNYQELSLGGQFKEYSSLYKQFNVSEPSPRLDETFQKIWEWAKSTATGKDRDSVLFEVLRLKNRLGSPSPGETPWTKVSNYVNVWRQAREAQDRLTQLENG